MQGYLYGSAMEISPEADLIKGRNEGVWKARTCSERCLCCTRYLKNNDASRSSSSYSHQHHQHHHHP